jgi:hypothetical protein
MFRELIADVAAKNCGGNVMYTINDLKNASPAALDFARKVEAGKIKVALHHRLLAINLLYANEDEKIEVFSYPDECGRSKGLVCGETCDKCDFPF